VNQTRFTIMADEDDGSTSDDGADLSDADLSINESRENVIRA
jgi:hypothetical protein